MSVFTIAKTTYTDDAKLAYKTPAEGAVGPFRADDDAGLYTMGNYPLSTPVEVIFPTANMSKQAIGPGVAMIMGPSESGKSWLGDQLSLLNGFPRVSFEEPVPGALIGERSLAAAMLQIPSLPQHAVVVDSLRTLFYTTAGNTGRGGMNMSLYSMLTQWDIWAKSHGKIIFIIINPIQVDETILELLAEAGSGSVETYISTPAKGSLTLKTRSEGRTTRQMILTTKQAPKRNTTISVSAPQQTETDVGVDGVLALFSVLQNEPNYEGY